MRQSNGIAFRIGSRCTLVVGCLLVVCGAALASGDCLRIAGADFSAQLPWFYHGVALEKYQEHSIWSFEVNGLELSAGKYTVAIVPKGEPSELAVSWDGRTFEQRQVREGRVELTDIGRDSRMLSFYTKATGGERSNPVECVLVYPAGRSFAEAKEAAKAYRPYERKIRLDEREILQKEHWDEFSAVLQRGKFGKKQLREMFEEILRWCMRRQVLDANDPHYGAIYSEEDKYDFRDAAAAAVCFMRAWRDTGDEEYRRRALLARAYVYKGQHRENRANTEQYGGFCQMVGGKWGEFRRLKGPLPNVTGVETAIVANLLVKTYELGLAPSQEDMDYLNAAATWVLNSEFHPGVFHHHQGSTTDCQNSNILGAMALARAHQALEKLGRKPPESWLEASRRGFAHYVEGQEAIGCWPYLFATIGRGQAFREQNLPDQGMGMYHFLVACDTPTFRDQPAAREAMKRAARWWLAMSRIDREPPYATIDLDSRAVRPGLRFSTFTWCRFMAAASLLRIAQNTDEKEPWRALALAYMEHVRTKLWNTSDPNKAPVQRAAKEPMTLYSWIQAVEWEGALVREMEDCLP